jgi:hypothetical protein
MKKNTIFINLKTWVKKLLLFERFDYNNFHEIVAIQNLDLGISEYYKYRWINVSLLPIIESKDIPY